MNIVIVFCDRNDNLKDHLHSTNHFCDNYHYYFFLRLKVVILCLKMLMKTLIRNLHSCHQVSIHCTHMNVMAFFNESHLRPYTPTFKHLNQPCITVLYTDFSSFLGFFLVGTVVISGTSLLVDILPIETSSFPSNKRRKSGFEGH